MTHLDKSIYNTYLRVSRTKQNKPFRYRKNFDKFDDDPSFVFVKKLSLFFTKFPHIKLNDFFEAPYNVYLDNSPYYDLKYYTTPKAVKVYGLYMKKRDAEDPDTDAQLNAIKESLMFLFTFCRDNKITVNEYLDHKTNNFPTFILHLRKRDITIYVLYALTGFDTMINSIPQSRLEFTLGDNFINSMNDNKLKYYKSKKAKRVIQQGIKTLTKILNTNKNKL